MSPLKAVTDQDFTREVLRSDLPVLMACGAAWCLPSEQLRPVMEEMAARYEGRAKVVSVDAGDDPGANKILQQYRFTRLPLAMLFHEGQLKDVVGGMASPEVIAEMVERRLKPVLEVAEYNFDVEVLRSRLPVLAHFAGAWCAASLELEPLVESVAERFRARAKVVRIEFGGGNAALCARYGIFRVPTLALFDAGEVRDQIFGAMKGGAKVEGERAASCVGLTSFENVTQMLEEFIL